VVTLTSSFLNVKEEYYIMMEFLNSKLRVVVPPYLALFMTTLQFDVIGLVFWKACQSLSAAYF